MSFKSILEEWESRQNARNKPDCKEGDFASAMNEWLDAYPPEEKDEMHSRKGTGYSRYKVKRMAPQASLDLHGHTYEEACMETDSFLRRCRDKGYRKVLIIHGKGLHSEKGVSVLKKKIRQYLQKHPLAGELKVPDQQTGGDGAIVVYLR